MAFEDDVIAKLDAIAADLKKGLQQLDIIEAEAVGSWQWDKVNGVLRLYSTTGQEVAVFFFFFLSPRWRSLSVQIHPAPGSVCPKSCISAAVFHYGSSPQKWSHCLLR